MRETHTMSRQTLVTAEEFARISDDGHRCELVEGRVVRMSFPGIEHAGLAVRLAVLLDAHVRANNLGKVLGEVGCHLARNPDTVRGPDVAFLRRERLALIERPEGFVPGGPDLVIEIRSPGDTLPETETKVDDYLNHGVRIVWGVDSRKKTVTVYRPLTPPRTLTVDDELDGGDVLPAFRCGVSEIFD